MIYIISKTDLKIKDVIQPIEYDINTSIKLTGKSEFIVDRKLDAIEGDFIVCGDYKGIIDSIETEKDTRTHTIHANEIDSIFDRKIILTNENLISTVGIEGFIKKTIEDHFTQSEDALLNIPYIDVEVLTHTKINASVSTEEGIYNFRTYLGNAREKYDICLDYEFKDGRLNIKIYKFELDIYEIDATVEDVITYEEVYSVDAIAKVTVLSKESGNVFNYFLRTDRTVTDDINDPNRSKGTIEVVTCEEDSEARQAALDAFKANSYQHNIELQLTRDSKVFDEDKSVIGRNLRIKTKDNGIYETFISKINKKSNSNIYTVTCGNMRVTLLDKLEGVVE